MLSPLAKVALDFVFTLRDRPNVFAIKSALLTDTEARTSCSSFLTLLLGKVYDVKFINIFGRRFPRAAQFAQMFHREQPVTRIEDIEASTLFAVAYDEEQEGMSGHCVVMTSKPQKTGADSVDGLHEYAVGVVDSCRSAHGRQDTRWRPTGPVGGIGAGTMALLAEPDTGIVRAFRWSLEVESECHYDGRGQLLAFFNIPSDWRLRHG